MEALKVIYALLLGLAIPLSSFMAHPVQDNYDRLERAANLIREGQLARAEAELQLVLRTHRTDPNALNLLGVIRVQQQRPAEAEKLFLNAIRHAPRMTGAYVNLGHLYLDQHKTERALWAYNEAAKLAPGDAETRYQIAFLYEQAGDCVKALAQLEKLSQSNWRIEEYHLGTKCYLRLGQNDKALATISSLQQTPLLENDETAAAFASILLKKDLTTAAISLLEKMLLRHPKSFHLLYQMGAAYAREKQWTKAEEFYSAALDVNRSSLVTLRDLAQVARRRGELEKALSYLVQARKLAPEEPAVLYDFAVVAFSMNLILDTLPVAEKLYRQQPDNPAYVHLLAVSRFRHDEKQEAEKLLRHYIQLRPKDTLGYYLLGVTLYTLKRYADARDLFQKSVTLGENPDSEYMLGLIAQTEGDHAAAVRWLRRVGQSAACYAAAQTLLGIVYAEQNNIASARTTLEGAVQLNRKDLRAHYQLGLVYSKLGEKEQARQMFAIADRLREEQRNEEVVTFKLIDPPEWD